MKHLLFLFIFFAFISCEEKVEFDDEYKYQLCIKLITDSNILSVDDPTYIINPEVKEFRFNDFLIEMHEDKKLKPIDYEKLSKFGFNKIDFKNAFLEHDNTALNFSKLRQFNSSRNVIRFSSIKCNLIFMDVIKYCELLTPSQLIIHDETELPLIQFDTYII
ncbi:MAG: hypothetical protein ABJD23_04370, partial [Nonlabens sp.]